MQQVTDALQQRVTSVTSKSSVVLRDICNTSSTEPLLLLFFTHWADLGSWELAQNLLRMRTELQSAGVKIVAVGLGGPQGGAEFSQLTGWPSTDLYADPVSACHTALGFSKGALADSDVNGYAKLLLMLAGIEAPGTMREVIRGYVGDRSAKDIFDSQSQMGRLFSVLGRGYQRPFELATVRLQNMLGSLSNWSKLAPEDTQQLVQQGGAVLVHENEVRFWHKDTGPLMTVDVDALLVAAQRCRQAKLPA